MLISKFISKRRIIDIKSSRFEDAIEEIVSACPVNTFEHNDKDQIVNGILSLERTMSMYLGNGISLPHLKLKMPQKYVICIGRCENGLEFEGKSEYKEIRYLFLLLASEKEKNYLSVLSSLAKVFQYQNFSKILEDTKTPLPILADNITNFFKGQFNKTTSLQSKFNKIMLKEAAKIANAAKCEYVFLFTDALKTNIPENFFKNIKVINVSEKSSDIILPISKANTSINVKRFSDARLSQLGSAIIIALTRNIVNANDKICAIGGVANSNQLDAVVLIDLAKEFENVFSKTKELVPTNIKLEVIERIIAIATELSIEGREGKSVGALFVIGNYEKIKPYTKQLVLNPFKGYQEEERNILNPFMDETIKEFSSLDGAFIISEQGVLESAGTLLQAPIDDVKIPAGLGTRHIAASAITLASDCITICISSSAGNVSLFSKGQLIPISNRNLK